MTQVPEGQGTVPRRMRIWVVGLAVVALVALVVVLTHGGGTTPPKAKGTSGRGAETVASHHVTPLYVSATTPSSGAANVLSDTDISVTFSSPVDLQKVLPVIAPSVAGTWVQSTPTTLTYDLAAPLIPSTTEEVAIPGGATGVKGRNGSTLISTASIAFSVATGDINRVQQILAELNYLPLSFTATGPAPATKDEAIAQPGSFTWRWPSLPAALTSLWTPGNEDEITKAAVEAFEFQNGLKVDGLPGPAVWTALLADLASQKLDTNSYVYVLVNKNLPESLTLYSDGTPQFSGIPVNTGAPGADTVDGSYAVFEHVTSSEMKGTNPNGTKYDDPDVPWASYFNGGDALHGFVRAQYGFPQSNGCVEMSVADAGMLWPYTPIGTLVTIEGPASPPLPTTTTTTTTAPAATTTTTAAPPPTTAP